MSRVTGKGNVFIHNVHVKYGTLASRLAGNSNLGHVPQCSYVSGVTCRFGVCIEICKEDFISMSLGRWL